MSEIAPYVSVVRFVITGNEIDTNGVNDMNNLIENNYIEEMQCGVNFSYILSDNVTFASTEYKVLQSQTNSCFLKCMKMLYNGKVQLYYLTENYKPFASLLSTIDSDSFSVICANLFADIIDVKNNGFLSCQDIDISFEKIYVDTATYKVRLVYIPVSKRLFDVLSDFENELRTSLIKLIQEMPTISTPKTVQFAANLANGTMSLENIYMSIKSGNSADLNMPVQPVYPPARTDQMKLVAMNAPSRVEITVNKDEFVIGKKSEYCDGVISFNPMISRVHCKICKKGSQYLITDLQSSNGTFVNHERLRPDASRIIKAGDIIRLANSDFQVVEE